MTSALPCHSLGQTGWHECFAEYRVEFSPEISCCHHYLGHTHGVPIPPCPSLHMEKPCTTTSTRGPPALSAPPAPKTWPRGGSGPFPADLLPDKYFPAHGPPSLSGCLCCLEVSNRGRASSPPPRGLRPGLPCQVPTPTHAPGRATWPQSVWSKVQT